MKRPSRLFSEKHATQEELLEHIRAWREYTAYLEGRLGIPDTEQVVAKATRRYDKKPIDDPNGAVELLVKSLIKAGFEDLSRMTRPRPPEPPMISK